MEAQLEAAPEVDVDPAPPGEPVTDSNAPVQDKPDLDDMAESLGIEPPDEEQAD